MKDKNFCECQTPLPETKNISEMKEVQICNNCNLTTRKWISDISFGTIYYRDGTVKVPPNYQSIEG